MSVDVSVVVPVYNTEPYLRECLDSLVNQTLKNVEFIFVDDGSTDRSYEILREYQQRDDRIQILRQQNLYAGVARNNGMKAATGKYIIFLDSDDFFELDMLEKAFNCAEENQTEITYFRFYYFDNITKEAKKMRYQEVPKGVFSPIEIGETMFRIDITAPWSKLYLKSFLDENDLKYQAIKKNNDVYFTCMALVLCKRIVCLNEYLLYYRTNNADSIQGDSALGRDSFVPALVQLKEEMLARGYFVEPYRQAYNYYADFSIKRNSELVNKTSPFELKKYYNSIKNKLVPDIFLSPEDFYSLPFTKAIFEKENFESFLFCQLEIEKEKNNKLREYNKELLKRIDDIYDKTVSKKSKDYIIGHTALTLPRMIVGLFKSRGQ